MSFGKVYSLYWECTFLFTLNFIMVNNIFAFVISIVFYV